MCFLTRRPRSAVADHLFGHSQLVNMRRPARLMGLRGEETLSVTSADAAATGGVVYRAVTTATTDSYVTAEIAFSAD
jgi:hypothetical protein